MINKFKVNGQEYTIKSRKSKGRMYLMYLIDSNNKLVQNQKSIVRELTGKLFLPESDCEMSTYEYFAYALGLLNK